jgi:carbon monoxide dehydrogenase subunit G
MPEGSVTFEVRAPIDRVWAFLSDMRQVGSCVPGVQRVEVLDDKRARWDLMVKIGPLVQTFVVTTETLEQTPPSRGRFHGVADNLDMIGTIELAPAGKSTKVVYTLSAHAKGPLSRIMDNFMRSRLKLQTEEFAASVKKALEP